MGTEITCAQCHDHPFEEVYQMDFYKMASFMGETETRVRGGGNSMMMMMGDGNSNYRKEVSRMSKILKDALKDAVASLAESDDFERYVEIDGVEYRYQVYFPAHWSGDKKWPVILFLHGYGEVGS